MAKLYELPDAAWIWLPMISTNLAAAGNREQMIA